MEDRAAGQRDRVAFGGKTPVNEIGDSLLVFDQQQVHDTACNGGRDGRVNEAVQPRPVSPSRSMMLNRRIPSAT